MAKILLMDDDVDYTSVLSELLTDANHSVAVVRAASEAFEALKEAQYDLLITDIIVFKDQKSVPDGGISLISRLRGPLSWNLEQWKKDMPIIAVSGAIHNQGMSGILQTARSLGADFALGKPTDFKELLHAINTLTARQK